MNNSWKVAVAFIVVFLAGGATAGIFTLRYIKPLPVEKPPPVQAPERIGSNLMQRLVFSNQLGLTPAQRAKIRPIIGDYNEDLRRLVREDSHSVELLFEHTQDEIAEHLTPDQRDKFNGLIANQRQKITRFLQQQQQRFKQQEMQQQAH